MAFSQNIAYTAEYLTGNRNSDSHPVAFLTSVVFLTTKSFEHSCDREHSHSFRGYLANRISLKKEHHPS